MCIICMYIEPQEEVEELDAWKICGKHPSLLVFLHILGPEHTNTPFLPPGRRRSLKPWRSAWSLSWRVANDRRWALTALDGCGKPAWRFQWRKWWRLSISGVMDQGLIATKPSTSSKLTRKNTLLIWRSANRSAVALINDLNACVFLQNPKNGSVQIPIRLVASARGLSKTAPFWVGKPHGNSRVSLISRVKWSLKIFKMVDPQKTRSFNAFNLILKCIIKMI